MGRGGTGLGMNIVYNIVTGVLGGRITIDSRPDLGTVIRIVIPRSSPQREGAAR
jgi:signal transduction histidine kinase